MRAILLSLAVCGVLTGGGAVAMADELGDQQGTAGITGAYLDPAPENAQIVEPAAASGIHGTAYIQITGGF